MSERREFVSIEAEMYSDTRKAELLLENAVDAEDYARAQETIRALGIDPDSVPHQKR